MPVRITKLGPGTVTVGEEDFAAEVTGATITHEYEETQESITMLSGDVLPASETRNDGFAADCMNNMTAAGLYAYCQDNDMQVVDFAFVPNTTAGATPASWTGKVVIKLPEEIGTDTFGNPLASSIEWKSVGALVFVAEADA